MMSPVIACSPSASEFDYTGPIPEHCSGLRGAGHHLILASFQEFDSGGGDGPGAALIRRRITRQGRVLAAPESQGQCPLTLGVDQKECAGISLETGDKRTDGLDRCSPPGYRVRSSTPR